MSPPPQVHHKIEKLKLNFQKTLMMTPHKGNNKRKCPQLLGRIFFSNFMIFESLMKIFQKIENLVFFALENLYIPNFLVKKQQNCWGKKTALRSK